MSEKFSLYQVWPYQNGPLLLEHQKPAYDILRAITMMNHPPSFLGGRREMKAGGFIAGLHATSTDK